MLTWELARRVVGRVIGIADSGGQALGAFIGSFVGLNAEVWLLSQLPLARPLDLLPVIHCALLVSAWFYFRRQSRNAEPDGFYSEVGEIWRSADIESKLCLAFTAVLLAFYLAYGGYMGLGSIDELAYHGPQALMLHQQGRLAGFDNPLPWVNAYPRGAAIVWGWTFFWTNSDILFHPLQLAFGLQLIVGVAVLARRLGAARREAIIVASVVACFPVFFRIVTYCTADLCYAAAVVSLVAFGLPSPADGAAPEKRTGLALAFLAFAQAAACKVPIVAGWALVLVLLFWFVSCRKELGPELKAALTNLRVIGAVLIALGGCQSYLVNWYKYSNPLYPITVKVGNTVVFVGPHPPAGNVGASTTMGNLGEMSLVRKFHAAWADWFAPLSEDSFGSFGPAFAMGLLFVSIVFFLGAGPPANGRRRLFLALLIFGWLLLPGFYLPRYSMAFGGCMAALAAASIAHWGTARVAAGRALLILGVLALIPVGSTIRLGAEWIRGNNGGEWLSARRTSAVAEHYSLSYPEIHPTPGMVSAIRNHCGTGSVLAWNVNAFQTVLWNRRYDNRVEFVPAVSEDRYPHGADHRKAPTPEQLQSWLNRLREIRADYVLVYDGTAYAAAFDTSPAAGFHRIFTDAPDPNHLAMVLYARTTGGNP